MDRETVIRLMKELDFPAFYEHGYDLMHRFAAAVEANCMPQWQPIETAPRDGTVFLGYKRGQFRECYKVQRDDCEMWCFGGTSGADDLFPNIKPTHWMPLPSAPAPKEES